MVMGSITDAFKSHPDYLTAAGKRSAHFSIAKRVTGSVTSFLEQREGRAHNAAATGDGAVIPAAAILSSSEAQGDGGAPPSPTFRPVPHPRREGCWTLQVAGPCPWFVEDPDSYRVFPTEALAAACAARLNKALAMSSKTDPIGD